MSSPKEESITNTNLVINLLKGLGFEINYKKSHLIPETKATYLGFIINSETMSIHIPRPKVEKIKLQCQQLISEKSVTIRELTKGIDLIVSMFEAFPQGKLHYRQMELAKLKHFRLIQATMMPT